MAKIIQLSKKKYLLIVGDIFVFLFSLWLTLLIRYYDFGLQTWQNHIGPFALIFVFWLIIFYIDDLYDLNFGRLQISLISRLVRDSIISGIIAVVFFYFATDKLFSIRPQRVLLIDLAITVILLYLWRLLFSYLVKNKVTTENTLFIGYNPACQEVIEQIKSNPALGYKVKTIISLDQKISTFSEIELISTFDNLKDICRERKIKTVIFAINPRDYPELIKSMFSCLELQINFYDIASFYEKITGKIPVKTIEQMWFLENLTHAKNSLTENTKRILDIILSFIIISISLPFFPFVYLAIKISSPGPLFFKQFRVGKNGKIFTIIKFRSMVVNAENNGPQWAQKEDPRVTKIGKILRKTRIDEIPQLINIIKGEMSLIGPRPERPEFVEQLYKEIPFYKERLLVKPGLTGWAQVEGPAYGGSKDESLEKLQYDLYYIKNQSLVLDLSILLKTIKTIVTRKGQ